MRRMLVLMLFNCLCVGRSAVAGQSFRDDMGPLIESSCIECHDADTKTALNLVALGDDLSDADTFRVWERIFDKVADGKMPPDSKDRPNAQHLETGLRALKRDLRAASLAKQQRVGRVPARRLTRLEFGYTIRDLLSIDGDITSSIPGEVESGLFDTVGSVQRFSAIHMEGYLKAVDEALDLAIRLGKNPYQRAEFDLLGNPFMNAFHELPVAMGGSVTMKRDNGVAMFIDADYLTRATNFGFHIRTPGIYRIKSTVSAIQSENPVTAKLILREPGGGAALLGAIDLAPGQTETMEVSAPFKPADDFYLTMEMGDTVRQDYAALVAADGAANYKGKGILIHAQEAEGPMFDQWPPPSTRQLLHGVKLTPTDESGSGPFIVALTETPEEHVAAIIEHLAPRILRRRPTVDELQSFVSLARPAIREGRKFEDVIRVPLRSMLTSPQFLMFEGDVCELDDYALASRLSYFLWKSMPDSELLALAEHGRLSESQVLGEQVDRMLKDERSARFVKDFLGQWWRLDQLNASTPDDKLYPEYDELLGDALPKEAQLFFTELLTENLSLAHLIRSDFTFLNSRLAAHYGIPGVAGQQFRKVTLPQDSPRGGVLTLAAVLKTTANGTVTSPVVRGNFVLTNFLGTPPDPPPPLAGSIEPDAKGKTTVRDILAAHRNIETCNKCHREIDPPGFAMECFDAIGGFRTHYRTIEGRNKTYSPGLPVDASGVTDDGRTFRDIGEFKDHMLVRKEQVAKNFVSQLIVYATGGEIQFADREHVDAILQRTRSGDFRVRDIVHAVIQSPQFRYK